MGAQPNDTPMDSTIKLDGKQADLFLSVGRNQQMVRKLIYLIVTHPDITYAVGVISQYMHAPSQPQYGAICRILH